jgi:hypothetical protein
LVVAGKRSQNENTFLQKNQLLDRAIQKHIIATVQQEKAEENKEKNLKGHCQRGNTNGCVAIHNEYYRNPKQTVS